MFILLLILNLTSPNAAAKEAPLDIVFKKCLSEFKGNSKGAEICRCHRATLEHITPEGKRLLAHQAQGKPVTKEMEAVEGGNIFVSFSADTKIECSGNPNFKFVEKVGVIEGDEEEVLDRGPESIRSKKAKPKK